MTSGGSGKAVGTLLLLVTAVIWGGAFSAQRIAAGQAGILLFNGFRFGLGALVLLPLLLWQNARGFGAISASSQTKKPDRYLMRGILAAGFLLFTAGGLQHFGLRFTTAGNAGFLTSLYVIFVPILVTLLGETRLRNEVWLAAILALIGAYYLSGFGFSQKTFAFNAGDGLEILGAIFWAGHVIVVGKLVNKMDVLVLAAGQFFVCSVLSLGFGLLLEAETIGQLTVVWKQIVYTGLLSVGLGYTLQAYGQRMIPPSSAALVLSLEAVFAAGFGWLWLDETLTVEQGLGCSLIFAGVLIVLREKIGKAS